MPLCIPQSNTTKLQQLATYYTLANTLLPAFLVDTACLSAWLPGCQPPIVLLLYVLNFYRIYWVRISKVVTAMRLLCLLLQQLLPPLHHSWGSKLLATLQLRHSDFTYRQIFMCMCVYMSKADFLPPYHDVTTPLHRILLYVYICIIYILAYVNTSLWKHSHLI